MKYYCEDCINEFGLSRSHHPSNWFFCDECGQLRTIHAIDNVFDKQEAIQYLIEGASDLSHRNEWVEAELFNSIEFVNQELKNGDIITKDELDVLLKNAECN